MTPSLDELRKAEEEAEKELRSNVALGRRFLVPAYREAVAARVRAEMETEGSSR
jgi:hypothetical protein